MLGHVSRFEKKLEKQIRTREREIERMCGFHYTNFVEAINELSGIEGDATKLVRKVASTNHDLQELGGKILGKCPRQPSHVHGRLEISNHWVSGQPMGGNSIYSFKVDTIKSCESVASNLISTQRLVD